jgi:DNA-binding SARP family transcriptional activator
MEFRILGPLEVSSDGRLVELGGAKQRALLAVLLLEANSVVSKDRLIDALWEDAPPESVAKALQVYVSALRKVVGRERLQTKAPGYVLSVADDELDLERFRLLQERGRPAEALALWRGGPLSDFADRRFARAEIARLEELHLACLEERIDQDLQAGHHGELVGELEALVAAHPLRERFRAQLMLALYRSGRQAEALDAYQAARRTLVDEFGIEPARELRQLQQQILNQDASLDLGVQPVADAAAVPEDGLVGRERELAELAGRFDQALEGRGGVVLLEGEAGIGKSRLAEALAGEARTRGAQVLVGRCWETAGAPPYWPWAQSLRAYVRTAEPAALRRQLGAAAPEVARIVPQLRELFPGLPEPEDGEPEATRARFFGSVAAFLGEVSADRPLVLVLDDLHAADEPSLLLLRHVADALGGSRVLIVGTFGDLGRDDAVVLSGLDEQEVARLADLTARAPLPTQLKAALSATTGGNPLFVTEVVRLLEAEGRAGHADEPELPQTLREATGRRLRSLSGECRRVLSLASVLGAEFGLVGLERVADYTGIDKLLEVLGEAVEAGVVEEVPGSFGRLRFGHSLVRETLYEEIPAAHRSRLHMRVATVLEILYGGSVDRHLAELAHHFVLAVPASPAVTAVEYARRAGDEAARLLAYEEAARLYRLALDTMDGAGPADGNARRALLASLEEVTRACGSPPPAAPASGHLSAARGTRR